MYDRAHVGGWDPENLHDLECFLGWICTNTYLAQYIITAGEELDGRDHDLSDLSDLSVRGV